MPNVLKHMGPGVYCIAHYLSGINFGELISMAEKILVDKVFILKEMTINHKSATKL